MAKNKDDMVPDRWAYLKQRGLTARYIHYSAMVKMLDNPLDPLLPKIPWIERPGHSLNMLRTNKKSDKAYEFWRRHHFKGSTAEHILNLNKGYPNGNQESGN